jgi:nucleotide-binding universal stress UspA family protein
MMIAQHILVPVDFSEHADQALHYALELAGKLGARLTLVHVIQAPVAVARGMAVSLDPYFQEVELEASATMNDYAQRAHAAGIACDIVILQGVPFQEIIDLASARQVDLIVMGTQGRTGLQRFVVGSVAERVVRLAPCPVLVTRSSTPGSSA